MSSDEPDSRPPERHDGPARTSPYPISRLAPAFDLVDVAQQIQEADEKLGIATSSKLKEIAAQIKALQERAREVMEETQRDLQLHRARCAFKRKVGHVYCLYEDEQGTYFSMLSPADWNDAPPHTFLGTYRLEIDQSFTKLDGDE